MQFDFDTNFGNVRYSTDLTRVREATAEDFNMSYVDAKQIVNALRVKLSDVPSMDLFKRSSVVLDFKSEGIYFRKHNDNSNCTFLCAKNLNEYSYKLIQRVMGGGESIVIDFNLLNMHINILRKLGIGELLLCMDNKISHSNGVKLHFVVRCENLLIIFGRKCNFDINLEAEYFEAKNNEQSAYKTAKQEVGSQLSNVSEHINSKEEMIEESQIGSHRHQKINYRTPPDSNALVFAKEQVKNFKYNDDDAKIKVENHEQSMKQDSMMYSVNEYSNVKGGLGFFQEMQLRAKRNMSESNQMRTKKESKSGLDQLMCNKR